MGPAFKRREEGICCGLLLCCPYGCFYTLPVICSLIAVLFTSLAAWTCDFFRVEYVNQPNNPIFYNSNVPSDFRAGPWTVQEFNMSNGAITSTGRCVAWANHDFLTTEDLDTPMKTARVILFLVAVMAYGFTSCFLVGSCITLGNKILRCIGCCDFCMALLIPISLSAFASSVCQDATDCSAGASAFAVIIAFVFWICAGGLIFTMREREKSVVNQENEHAKRQQQREEDEQRKKEEDAERKLQEDEEQRKRDEEERKKRDEEERQRQQNRANEEQVRKANQAVETRPDDEKDATEPQPRLAYFY
ncbi:hypothetical protein ACA910_008746 [Epithemia clementina (nom. ined.)]